MVEGEQKKSKEKINKEQRLLKRAMNVLARLTTPATAEQVSQSFANGERPEPIMQIDSMSTGNLSSHRETAPLTCLLENNIFSANVAKGFGDVLAILRCGTAANQSEKSSTDDNSDTEKDIESD